MNNLDYFLLIIINLLSRNYLSGIIVVIFLIIISYITMDTNGTYGNMCTYSIILLIAIIIGKYFRNFF